MTRGAGEITVSVVICTYAVDRWEALSAAVQSASRQTLAPLEIIVVVDHNLPLLARARRELAGATVAANLHARGLSGSRNTGVASASGEIVAFLDDDALPAPDWLEQLTSPYRDPTVVSVGGAIEPRWLHDRPAWFPPEFEWVVGCTYRGAPTASCSVRNVIGANMSFRREVFGEVGGFRTEIGRVGLLPAGCEETELCIRTRQRLPGTTVRFEPRARVAHAVPPSRGTWSYFRSRCFAEGRSKARVSSSAGSRDALRSERAYTLRTLPRGVLRGLVDSLRGDASGLTRSATIVAGLGLTTLGYLVGGLAIALARYPPADPLPELDGRPERPRPEGPPRLSVVVLTCGRAELLAACLDSILAGDYPHYEIVVVDNAPYRSATAELLSERYRTEGRIRRAVETRAGTAWARIAGLAAAREAFVAFVDDDVIVDRSWLSAISEAFSSEADVAAVTTLILPRTLDRPAQRWLEQFGGFSKGDRRRVFDLRTHRSPDRLYPYSPGIYGSGASMAFRTRTLRELGGFDPRLAIGGEDLDAFLKVILGGHRLVYEPAAVAWHHHRTEYRSLERTMFRYGAGLSALMTKWLVSDRKVAVDIASRLPAALRLALDGGSRKNAGKLDDYPSRLTRLELAGMLAGPFVYAHACWSARRADDR
ncbi:MAG: glycosyl transferase family 2 [Conexibacter sp.]|nr:glycosyl transferase family 2 [Conexibacter sp.]